MGKLYALLVGINDYRQEESRYRLKGCLNDVETAEDWLTASGVQGPRPRTLHDHQATKSAVVAAIRGHLGRARKGDTALLWFAGHGTTLSFDAPEHAMIEPTGENQALVCYDDPLQDKELGPLLEQVAEKGAHVVAVLDCCYAGGATRDPNRGVRWMPPQPGWRAEPGDGSRDLKGKAYRQRHVLFAASGPDERARERNVKGSKHGLFTYGMLDALRQLGPTVACRALLDAAGASVRRWDGRQQPVLRPTEVRGPADRPFIVATIAHQSNSASMTRGREGWEVNYGAAHGLRVGDAAEQPQFAVPTPSGVRIVRAKTVYPDRTLVEPIDWTPDPAANVYPAAPSDLAVPPSVVRIDATDADPRAERSLRDALEPPSPWLSLDTEAGAPHGTPTQPLLVRIRGDRARILPGLGLPDVPELPLRGSEDARRIIRCLTHVTRWYKIREMDYPGSPLTGHVKLEIAPFQAVGEAEPLQRQGNGEFLIRYTRTAGSWKPPQLSIRLRNRAREQTFWCVLLDLTDSYEVNTTLFPGYKIAPQREGYALDGRPVPARLPRDRPAVPGAFVRDWLKLIVATRELNTVPLQLPPLRDGPLASLRPDALPIVGGGSAIPQPTGAHEGGRDLGRDTPEPDAEADPVRWAVTTIPLRTVVPEYLTTRGG